MKAKKNAAKKAPAGDKDEFRNEDTPEKALTGAEIVAKKRPRTARTPAETKRARLAQLGTLPKGQSRPLDSSLPGATMVGSSSACLSASSVSRVKS